MIGMVSRFGIPTIVLVAVLALASTGAAEIVRWADEHGNVHYADGLWNVPAPYRSSAQSIGLRNAPAPPAGASEPSRPTEPTQPRGGATIRFTPGQRITVEAVVNARASVRLLLDTGADRTLISPRALESAGVRMNRAITGSIVGVTGRAEAQGVPVDSLEVQDARVTRLHVVAYDMDRQDVDGLLGRDFLEQFNVNIDSSTGTVTILPK
jgi:predicted aspartyl protease